jgi:hypothetical protein
MMSAKSLSLSIFLFLLAVATSKQRKYTDDVSLGKCQFLFPVLEFKETKEANAFITFHLHNPRLIAKVYEIQRELLEKDWRFGHTFQPLNSLHVSLIFVHLNLQNFNRSVRSAAALL